MLFGLFYVHGNKFWYNYGDEEAVTVKKSNVDMLSGSITKGLLSMTLPIMIMNVMQNMFSVIDMSILGNFASDISVGAVGACSSLISLCTGLLIGCSAGANVVVARHIGENDKSATEKAIATSFAFSILGGIVLMVIGVVFAETFLKLTNCPDVMLKEAVTYFRIYFLGVPVILLYNFSASILRASGDTKRPMYYLILGGCVKISLNFFLITVCNTTVDGVAIATIASNGIAALLCIRVILKSKDKYDFSLRKTKIYLFELKKILYIGIPTGLQQAMYSFANVIIVSTVNSFGPDATTGISIANQFDGILYQIVCATPLASMPYIAQNIGARNIKRAKRAVLTAMLITSSFGIVFGSMSAIFSRSLASTMSSTPAVIEYARQKMIIISSTYFLNAINEILGGALKAMNKPLYPTVTTMIFMCGIRFVWVYLIFPLYPTLTFLYLIWPIGWVLSSATLTIPYFRTMADIKRNLCN